MRRKRTNKPSIKIPSLQQSALTDENGRVVVNMTVGDDSNFLSMFSVTAKPVISSEVAEFMEFSTQLLPPDTDITLRIHSNCIDEREQKIYSAAIKEFYCEQYIVTAKELKRNHISSALLALAGILCLVFMFFMEQYSINMVWSEAIDIVAWVFLWEAVDIHFFRNRKLTAQKIRYTIFANMNIEYMEAETNHSSMQGKNSGKKD